VDGRQRELLDVAAAVVCLRVTFVASAPSSPANKLQQSEPASEDSAARSPSVNALLSWPVLIHEIAAR
jgi:hypothetical protein